MIGQFDHEQERLDRITEALDEECHCQDHHETSCHPCVIKKAANVKQSENG